MAVRFVSLSATLMPTVVWSKHKLYHCRLHMLANVCSRSCGDGPAFKRADSPRTKEVFEGARCLPSRWRTNSVAQCQLCTFPWPMCLPAMAISSRIFLCAPVVFCLAPTIPNGTVRYRQTHLETPASSSVSHCPGVVVLRMAPW
jgi:hypothetical protein